MQQREVESTKKENAAKKKVYKNSPLTQINSFKKTTNSCTLFRNLL